MKSLIKKLIPKFVLRMYHFILAKFSAFWFGYPSRKMVVIGVTGTKGKSTTSYFIAKILENFGFKVGMTGTALFKINEKEWLNKFKMTMLGRFGLQKLLKDMVLAGCKYAIVETSSEGIAQSRHIGIDYDIAVFTNLTPEHLESHGGFENYKKAKGKLFKGLLKSFRKKIDGIDIPKIIVANMDDEHAPYFLNFSADEKITFGMKNHTADIKAENFVFDADKSVFEIGDDKFEMDIPGKMNAYNALASIAVSRALSIGFKQIKTALAKIKTMPGRMEFIEGGQDFKVIVDYAHEPESFRQIYETVEKMKKRRIIHVFGATGGGRDKSRRPLMGKMASDRADIAVITTDDPYDERPEKIANNVFAGVAVKNREKVLIISDRKKAIKKAIEIAEKDDIVLITGKGCEQAMVLAKGKKIPWDDREIAREMLRHSRKS
jgi:UDP-N-acetylmuramoyl-L-alanyl-D-glutamate--2,6-diaminopimelate ligase